MRAPTSLAIGTPSARASASTSVQARSRRAAVSGRARSGPIGSRAAPVRPAKGARYTNFSHNGTRPSPCTSASTPAFTKASRSATARGDSDGRRREDLAEGDAMVGTGLHDDTGRRNGRRDVRGAAEHARFADDRRRSRRAVHAILERQDQCRGSGERCHQRKRRRVVVGLHGDQHDVARADSPGIVMGGRARDEFAAPAADHQAVGANGREVRASRDHDDVVAGSREPCGVIAPDRAGPDDRDPSRRLAL